MNEETDAPDFSARPNEPQRWSRQKPLGSTANQSPQSAEWRMPAQRIAEPKPPWYHHLTHTISLETAGLNGVGVVQLAIVFIALFARVGAERRSELLTQAACSLIAGLVVVASDVAWRTWLSGATGWHKWLSPTAGGSMAVVPGWLVGLLSVAFGTAVGVRGIWFARP